MARTGTCLRPSPLNVVRLLYVTLFGAGGAWVPYLMIFMVDAGLSPQAAGLTYAAMAGTRVVGGPIWGMLADRLRRDSFLIRLGASLAALTGAAALLGLPAAALAAVFIMHAGSKSALGALVDTQAVRGLQAAGRPPTEYGQIRLWGSVGYLSAGLVAGALADHLGPRSGIFISVGLLGVAALAAGLLPAGEPRPPTPLGPALRATASNPAIVLIMLAAVLHGTALATYDTMYSVHVASLGLPQTWVGAALVVGIGVELGVLFGARRIIGRIDPFVLSIVGMLTGAARWGLISVVTDPILLTALQALHGLAYAAWWIGSIELLRRLVPDDLRASSTATFTAAGYGIGPMLCGLLASAMVDGAGTVGVFRVSAGLSLAAAALAFTAARFRPAHGATA